MSELSPTQVALRELMILTRCYCDGEHPRLGHNCSFRRDVETVVAAVQRALDICDTAIRESTLGEAAGYAVADDVRRAVLGLDPDPGPPWNNGNATPDVSDGEGSASGPG